MVAKRAAESELVRAAPAKAKKAKATRMLDAVITGLCASGDGQGLPEEVRRVLVELARGGLMSPADERHAYQVAAIRKVGEVLEDQRRALEEGVQKAEEDVARSECEVRAFNEEQSRASAERSAAAEGALAARRRLAEATRVLLASRDAIKEAETSEERTKSTARDAEVEKAKIESMLKESLQELQEAGPSGKPCKSLAELTKKLAIDESLSAALAGAAAHSPEERSSFDKLALEQFERQVEQFLAPLVAQIEAAAPGIEACKAATEKAHAEERHLRVALLEAAADYRQAAAAEKEIVTRISEFDARTSALDRQGANFAQAVDERRKELELFQSSPIACFETLRERTSTGPEEAAAELEKKISTEPEPAHAHLALGGQ